MKHVSLFSLKKETIKTLEQIQISSSEDANRFARNFYDDDLEIYESCFIICLNRANKVIGYAKISQGGVCGTVVDANIIGKYAIESLSKGIILVHNHPTGNCRPSREDDNITNKVSGMLSNFTDSRLLDHLILTYDNYYSYQDNGKL